MIVALGLLVFGVVMALPPPDSGSKPDSASDASGDSAWISTSWNSGSSGNGDYNDVGYSGGSSWGNWGSVGGSGSGWDWGWDGDAGWDPTKELWHFRPSWNWDSPYPPDGTMYIENWGNPPTREIPSRRSFYLGADKGVSLAGATAEGGRADCGWRDWCVHLTFHSSYGVLSDFDAFVLDRYDSAERVYGDGFWYAREDEQGSPMAFAPLVLGGFSPEERDVLGNISSWKVEEMARRFNETRTTTWTLYPNSDELDVILSFKQLYTLLPGYPDGNITDSEMNSDAIKEWGAGDQVLLRVIAKREGSGATSAMMPRVLNFTGSQLFQVEYYSSLEYPQDDDGNINAAANGVNLDVIFGRRRYGSGLPWNPARPSDSCDACNRQVMNHPVVARCLHGHVPERIFEDIYEQSVNEQMEWDGGEWDVGASSNVTYDLNDIVDACFSLRWLLNGKTGDGSWSSGSGFTDAGDRQFSSGPAYGDAGYGWSGPGSGSGGDRYSDEGRWTFGFREPVYRYDDSGSRWSSWGYRDVGSASTFGDTGSRWSSGGPSVGDGPSVRNVRDAISIVRETDTGIQCFVESRCPVGSRNFAEAAGRMVVLDHEHAFVRVNFTEPNYRFYMWMGLEGVGSEGQFTTPELSSDHTPDEIAELVASAAPNASDYNIAVDVRIFNNLEIIHWATQFNDWIKHFYGSGGSKSEASAAWAAHSTAADDGSSFQFPPVGEGSTSGYYQNVGHNSDSLDGTSPDAGQGSNNWWFSDPYPVPDPQYTVEISFRNVSVVPNILDVFVVGDDPMDSVSSNMSWDARGSSLRFQLSPLNLTTFEYVPPPPYVNLTWNEEFPEYPDPYSNGSLDDWGVWDICSECTELYNKCDNSLSCKFGVRALLHQAWSLSRFDPYEISESESDGKNSYDRARWGVDFGPTLRQSAVFFTAEGYGLFMNMMDCLSKFSCDLDPSRQVYSLSKGTYISAEPTLLDIIAAKSVFAVPNTTTGEPENIMMKYRGKESLFTWNGQYKGDPYQLRQFISGVLSEYNADGSSWTRNQSETSWVDVQDSSDKYAGASDFVFYVTFGSNYFVEMEPPRFRAVSSDEYNELNSSNWKAIASAYRNPDDEKFDDGVALVKWRKLINWVTDLGRDLNVGNGDGNATADDLLICHQCVNSWTECVSNQSCADAVRYDLLGSFWIDLLYTKPRSSLDISATLASWKSSADAHTYAQVLEFFSCLSAESCPIGYAQPSNPLAPLVPITITLASHFAVTIPLGRSIVGYFNDDKFTFSSQGSSVKNLENWLRSTTEYKSVVNVQESINGSFLRYDISYYPAVAAIPDFYFEDDKNSVGREDFFTFGTFQLSSTQVQYGQGVYADLLYYWFGRIEDTRQLVYYFNDPQVCHGCPECWKALARCQNDMDCVISTRDVLVPLLRNATLPLSVRPEYDNRMQVMLDLSTALLSLRNEAFQSREGWLAFAHLIYAMSSCKCEVGVGQSNPMRSYSIGPTRILIDSHVKLSVRLYSNTQLDVWFNGNVYKYSTDGSTSPKEAANKFLDWFRSMVNSDSLYITMDNSDPVIEDMSQSATFIIHLYEAYNDSSVIPLLLNPNWIPTFSITSADVSSKPSAEVIVTPWKILLQSIDRYPVFDRMLNLLEYGGVSDDTPTSSGGSFAGSSTGDGCANCAEIRQACFSDEECKTAISDRLLPNLRGMGTLGVAPDYWFDMSSQILDGVFYGIQSLQAKQKLLALLTCSATKWTITSGLDGASCIQLLADKNYPGVSASLEITQATSTFPVNKGKGMNVYSLTGETRYYNDDGDSAALAKFMEEEILGGYENSGVRVKALVDWDSWMYTVIYDGLTASKPPFIESQSSSTSMQFKFTASTPKLLSAFNSWTLWLDPYSK